jgi:hypothetical protein
LADLASCGFGSCGGGAFNSSLVRFKGIFQDSYAVFWIHAG